MMVAGGEEESNPPALMFGWYNWYKHQAVNVCFSVLPRREDAGSNPAPNTL